MLEAEAEAEDKILASRTAWPRGLNITAKVHAVIIQNAATAEAIK